jgi:hypothetical protein
MIANETGIITVPKSGALGPYLRVIVSGGVLALAGAQEVEIGTTNQRYLASGVGQDDIAAVVTPAAPGIAKFIASAAISAYARVYGAASGKVSDTVNGNYIGIALAASTADGDEIEVLRIADLSGLLYANVAASAAHTNTTTEALFDKSYTLPANLLKAGDRIRIRAQGIATATDSTDTLTVKLYIGGLTGTAIAATAAVDVANGDIFFIDAELEIRTIGGSGTFTACGVQALGVPGTVTAKPFLLGSTAIDTTATQVIGVGADWSVAAAANSCRLDVLTVQLIRA